MGDSGQPFGGQAGAVPATPPPVYNPAVELFQAAQLGQMETLSSLIQKQVIRADHADNEGITALHWAAINNRVEACELLIKNGADVNAVGGELRATPIHWAARQGHLKLVYMLVQKGADPHFVDRNKTNLVHIAAQSGFPYIVLYAKSLGVDINALDENNRTPLMRACYRGLSIEATNLLIKFRAAVNLTDNAGNTALHWAARHGSEATVQLLLKNGADPNTVDKDGKTPAELLSQKNNGSIAKILEKIELSRPDPTRKRHAMLYAIPFITLGINFAILTQTNWLIGCILFGAIGYGAKTIADSINNRAELFSTPILTGFYQASYFWCAAPFFLLYMWDMPKHPFLNVLLAGFFILTAYLLYKTIYMDPGIIAPCTNEDEINATIKLLMSKEDLTARSFCNTCMIRRPLRSKHDRTFDHCYARYDHYCPWVYSVVGANNHRVFIAFIISTVIAQMIYVYLAIVYAGDHVDSSIPLSDMCLLSASVCSRFQSAPFAMYTAIWCVINGLWEFATLVSQLQGVAAGLTTNETINYKRYDYLHHGHSHGEGDADHSHGGFRGTMKSCYKFWTEAPTPDPYEIVDECAEP